MNVVDAVITAGGIPEPNEPLYPLTQGKSKALLPIGGRPMVQWVLDALSGADTIRNIVVVGLSPDDAGLTSSKTLGFIPNQGSMINNIQAGVQWILELDASARHALVVSSDIPTIRPDIVDWNVNTSLQTDHEAYYSVIHQQDMERRFPESRRSYFRLKEGRFSGGDMNMLQTAVASHYHPAWRAIVDSRKNILKQAGLVGLDTMVRLAAGQLSIAGAERAALKRLGLRGRVMLCPHAEAGMDVDKPAQYEMLKAELEARRLPA
jgi:CTP:molybdopterin cytidylyltransferase MocA